MSKQKVHLPSQSSKSICNICGHPGVVTYQEQEEDSRKIVTKSHTVPCLGHYDVFPYLWNQHPDYEKFRKYFSKQQRDSEGKD
jgi:hypothetical protein